MANTTDRAAIIRTELKAKGWTSRDVSVRADYYSMGSTIRIVIKNPAVPMAVVKAVAEQHEDISRDQWGDILSGGNRFVDIGYSSAAIEALSAPYLPALKAAADAVAADASDTSLHPVGDTGYLLGRAYNDGSGFSLWRDGHIQSANTAEYLASTLAIALQGVAR